MAKKKKKGSLYIVIKQLSIYNVLMQLCNAGAVLCLRAQEEAGSTQKPG